ncbi:LysR family transcriptional regulator [Burkholderia sp. WSM2232]|uniref:LysR family transcriptional regulator n=1 Tax=Burkholderia sp. WSM2232 TaxID=944436 RepID=UPI00047FE7D1|nr:LysR family transcriptional regulator [Burkholderia sp. WSM2232]
MGKIEPDACESATSSRELPSMWQLRVFEAVARHENVTQASQELLRSQPTTTSSIAAFEAALDVTLFERSTTGMWLTPVGVAAQVRVRRILQSAEEAMSALGSTRKASALALASGITRTQMRCLIAIEESGSFRAAARRLGITEASLQRAARTLEQNLGVTLYRHTPSGVATNETGGPLARRLQQVSNQIAALVEAVGAFEYPKERSVTVGVLLLDPTILILNAIRALSQQFPDTRVTVLSGTYETLINKLSRGDIDFMIGLLKQPGRAFDLVEEPLYRERYFVVASRDHPLTREGALSMEALRGYPWVLPPKGSPRREAYENLFSEGTPPPARIETYSLSTIRITLTDMNMLTVLSWTEILSERRFGLVAPLCVDVPWKGPMFGITMRRDWTPNDVQAEFLLNLRKNAAAIGGNSLED